MRIPSRGGNRNGSEPRASEEKTNATSGISTPEACGSAAPSAAQQRSPQIKEQRGGKSQRWCFFIIKNTKRKRSPPFISVRPLSFPRFLTRARGAAAPGGAGLAVLGYVKVAVGSGGNTFPPFLLLFVQLFSNILSY